MMGRPVRQERFVTLPIRSIPDAGYITPRLQPKEATANPIGFHAEICFER